MKSIAIAPGSKRNLTWKRFAPGLGVAVLLAVASVPPAAADSALDCDPGAVAAEYDRKADAYEAAAERYHAWATAEDMFATEWSGRALDLLQQAARLDEAAKRNRARAAESRTGEHSTAASRGGCGVGTPTGAEG